MKYLKSFNESKNNIDVQITNLPDEVLNRIISDFSIIAWKGKKRNGQKNYKSVRPIIIDGYYNQSTVNLDNSESSFLLKITLSNKDYIEAKYDVSTNIESIIDNNVSITINQKSIYDLGHDDNDEEKFLTRVRDIYIKYLEKKKWKIK